MSDKPWMRISGLYMRNFPPIKKLDWPQDGLGWNEGVPDMVVVGGINGSGKTTLLNFLEEGFSTLDVPHTAVPTIQNDALHAYVDIEFFQPGFVQDKFRLFIGDDQVWIEENKTTEHWAVAKRRREDRKLFRYYESVYWQRVVMRDSEGTILSRLVHFPSERDWVSPDSDFKAAGIVSR